jgi:hypothetical protein
MRTDASFVRSASGTGVALGVEGLRAMTQPKALHLLRPAAAAAAA